MVASTSLIYALLGRQYMVSGPVVSRVVVGSSGSSPGSGDVPLLPKIHGPVVWYLELGGPFVISGHGGRTRVLVVTMPSWFVKATGIGVTSMLGRRVKTPAGWPRVMFMFDTGIRSVVIASTLSVIVVVVTTNVVTPPIIVEWPTSSDVV